jgi:AcrR family transcriptional regulator
MRKTMKSTVSTQRSRRSASEVQSRILAAARENFARKGYAAASVREIADAAGVYEPMIYRRFPTKAELFEIAVLAPLGQVITDYMRKWNSTSASTGPGSTEQLVRSFVPPLYRLMVAERELIVAYLAAQQFDPALFEGHEGSLPVGIRRLVDMMIRHVELEAERRPLPDLDARRALVSSFGMMLGVALLEESAVRGVVDEALVEEMVKFTLWGVAARPAGATTGQQSNRSSISIAPLLDQVADAERRAIRAELELAQYRTRYGDLP